MCAGLMTDKELSSVPDGVSGKVFKTYLKIHLDYFHYFLVFYALACPRI